LCAVMMAHSCATPKGITYFQDLADGSAMQVSASQAITIRPSDKISIIVKSSDPQLSDLFNLPIVSHRVGQGSITSLSSSNMQVSSYAVDSNGDIDFPVLGKIHVEGLKREEVGEHIKDRLVSEDLVKDPVVTVEFDNLRFSVLGEVKNPGQFSIDRDRITVLDAISRAGDLTIYGVRDSVTVLRQQDGEQVAYKVNLLSGEEMCSSPAFYLQQNDVVYVSPNDVRIRQSTVNGNNIRSTSFWISLSSLLTSVMTLVLVNK